MRRTALVLISLFLAAPAAAHPSSNVVDAVRVPVSDLERSARFFVDVLEFERAPTPSAVPGTVTLRLGEERLVLVRPAKLGRRIPKASKSNDLWFQHVAIIVRDMKQAHARLVANGVEPVSLGPQRLPDWNPAAGGIEAFYFRDPDGHVLEILHFPPGKGAPKWARPSERLFLGIDHTAIAVADSDRSISFYRDLLGLEVRGESTNYGPEQEKLNAVPGAHLRITALRGSGGIAVELLEYVLPGPGRPYPLDTVPSDLWQWETVVSGSVQASFLIRDPDGHALRFTP